MNRTYYILASILVLLGLGMFVLEAKMKPEDISPQKILMDLNENTRYITTDELARRIIEGDPSVQLIDIRDPYDYSDFSLPGAENVPIADLCTEAASDLFFAPGKDFIFYSNGDVEANKAWMLAKRSGFNRLYILRGGLNKWIETIIQPVPPDNSQPLEAFDLYESRLGASQFFTGGGMSVTGEVPKEEIQFERKTKKHAVEGGC